MGCPLHRMGKRRTYQISIAIAATRWCTMQTPQNAQTMTQAKTRRKVVWEVQAEMKA